MIIDFRVRPPFEPYSNCNLFPKGNVPLPKMVGKLRVPFSKAATEFSLELCLQEAREAGIDKLVVPCRRVLGNGNEALVKLVNRYPDIIIGMAGILASDIKEAKNDIKKYVLDGPCKGIILEPGQDPFPWMANAAWAYPLYEFCQKNNVPIAFTYGGIMTRSLRYYDPLVIDDVAGAFPELKIALCHGGWPYVTECCQIALNRQNVWLAPDIYMVESPGMTDYIRAAGHMLVQRMLFATAWPLLPFKYGRDAYEKSGVPADALPYFMGKNAAEFLGLTE